MASNTVDPKDLVRNSTRFSRLYLRPRQNTNDTNKGQRPDMVVATAVGASGQTANILEIKKDDGTLLAGFGPQGQAVGLGGFSVAHAKYDFAVDGGAQGAIVPAATVQIPDNAIIVGATINPTTAPVGVGATIAVGTSAGSAANSIKTATAITSLTLDALVNGTATFAAPVKMTAAGNINITIATADLTAGVLEIFVFYVQALA